MKDNTHQINKLGKAIQYNETQKQALKERLFRIQNEIESEMKKLSIRNMELNQEIIRLEDEQK